MSKDEVIFKELPSKGNDLTRVMFPPKSRGLIGILQYTCDFTESSYLTLEKDQQLPLFKLLAEHLGYEVEDD